jgi:hypothetical protein
MARSPLERAEWRIFGMAVSDARSRAARGDLKAAYACLLFGLHRMEETLTGGDEWAGELLEAYRGAAESYERAGVPAAGKENG